MANGTTKLVSKTPRKGFHTALANGLPLYVRDGHHLAECTGAAHSNPHIDHCMCCINVTWGYVVEPNAAETTVSEAQAEINDRRYGRGNWG